MTAPLRSESSSARALAAPATGSGLAGRNCVDGGNLVLKRIEPVKRAEAIGTLVDLLTGHKLISKWSGKFAEIIAEERDYSTSKIGGISIEPCSLRSIV